MKLFALLALLAALFVAWLPTPLEPTVWRSVTPLIPLEGPYAATARNSLAGAADVDHLDAAYAPESLAVDAASGAVYASLGDGRVVRWSSEALRDAAPPETVFFSGGFMAQRQRDRRGRRESGAAWPPRNGLGDDLSLIHI